MTDIARAIKRVLRPHETNDVLVRLGRDRDGGYVVPHGAICSADVLYSYGVGDDISFECDWASRTAKPAHLYDHTVAATQLPPNQVFHAEALDGDNFFDHLDSNGDYESGRVLLKVDVEGDEYKFLQWCVAGGLDGIANHVHCPIVEFHDIFRRRFLDCMEELLRFYRVLHFHFNNYGPFTDGIGHTVEVTLLRRDHEFLGPTNRSYPIAGLDFPNNGIEEGWRLSYDA